MRLRLRWRAEWRYRRDELSDGLRDDGLAVAGRAVHEHRVPGVDRGPELIQHALADHQVRERLAHALAGGAAWHGLFELGMYRRYCSNGTGATPT